MIQDFLIIKNMDFVFQNLVKANALARIRQIFTYEIFTEQVNGNINITGSQIWDHDKSCLTLYLTSGDYLPCSEGCSDLRAECQHDWVSTYQQYLPTPQKPVLLQAQSTHKGNTR